MANTRFTRSLYLTMIATKALATQAKFVSLKQYLDIAMTLTA